MLQSSLTNTTDMSKQLNSNKKTSVSVLVLMHLCALAFVISEKLALGFNAVFYHTTRQLLTLP